MKNYRYAAIDIGSNAIRLLISEIIETQEETRYKKRVFVRVPIRLGDDAFTAHKIKAEKVDQLQSALFAFHSLMKLYNVTEYMACATSALREADNANDIIQSVKQASGLKLEVIDGKVEAEIIYANHIAENLDNNKSYLYIDVGGGSTELTLFAQNKIVSSSSFKVGTVRMLHKRVEDLDWKAMKTWVKEKTSIMVPITGIGTGGNINRIFKLANQKEGKTIKLKAVKDIYEELKSHSKEELISSYAMNEDRADVIVHAADIFTHVMKWGNIDEIYVPRLGLADGIIHMLYERRKP